MSSLYEAYGIADEAEQIAPSPAPEKSSLIRRIAGDGILTAVKGAIGVPEAAIGLADLATGGYAGKLAEDAGFRPKDARAILDGYYSPEQKAAFAAVQNAANPEDGLGQRILDTGAAALQNPSTIAHAVGESLPLMGAGGVVGRGVMALAPKAAGYAAAGIGEGVMAAGSSAEQIRQQTSDGYLTGSQSLLAAGSGALTGGIGIIAGRAAKRMGIGDIDTLMVGGSHVDPTLQKGFVRQLLEGAFSEGVLEELPQSVQEQMAQNYALGKPLDESVDQAVVMGMLSGGAMGAGAQVIHRRQVPEVGPLSRGANLAGGTSTTAPTAPVVAPAEPQAQPGGPTQPAVSQATAETNPNVETQAPAQGYPGLLEVPEVSQVKAQESPVATPDKPAFDPVAEQAKYRAETQAMQEREKERVMLDEAVAPVPLEDASPQEQAAYQQEAKEDSPSADDLFPAPPSVQPGDILNTQGKPFTTMPGAMTAQRKAGDAHEIVRVANGFVVRKKEATDGPAVATGGLAQGANEPTGDQPGGSGVTPLAEPVRGQSGDVQDTAGPAASRGPAVPVPLPGGDTAAIGKEIHAEQTHWGQLHARADKITSTAVTQAREKFENGDIDAPEFEAAIAVAEGGKSGTSATESALPAHLAGAKPRYGNGAKQFTLEFASDIDRAAYIAAQATPSKRDAEYVAHVTQATGMTEAEVRAHGQAVRDAIKAQAKDAAPGLLQVPQVPSTTTQGATHGTQTAETITPATQQETPERVPGPQVATDGVTTAISALRAKAHNNAPKTGPRGDIRMSSHTKGANYGQWVSFDDAEAAAREAVASGVRPVPFQIHDALDVNIGDTDRIIAALNGAAKKSVTSQAAQPIVKPKPVSLKQRMEKERTSRADYFTPGNIVTSYGGHDEVLSYTPSNGDGNGWSVKVRAVVKQDGKWIADPKDNRERSHSTQPDARDLKSGPVERASVPEQTTGDFGPILTQYRHDARGAIKALTELQDGEAVAALQHPEVGDIDLVWGVAGTVAKEYEDGYGLAKISIKHPEILSDLQGFLLRLHKDDAQSGKNRIRLVDDRGTSVVRLQWNGSQKIWLLTAFENEVTPAAGEGRTGVSTNAETATPAEQGAGSNSSVAQSSVEGKQSKPAKIEDSGEVLEGARKLYAKNYAAKLAEGEGMATAAVPLSKSWPEPDYQRLLDEGVDPWAVAMAHAMRDEIPNKPSSWKLKGWVQKVEALRDMASKVMSGEMTQEKFKTTGGQFNLADWFNKIDLYEAVGHAQSLKTLKFSLGEYGMYGGQTFNPAKKLWTINHPGTSNTATWRSGNWGNDLVTADTKAEAIEKFKAWSAAQVEKAPAEAKATSFDIYSYRSKPGVTIIGKRINSTKSIDLKEFASVKEAREYKASNQSELERLLANAKFEPSERGESNAPRVGADHRNGADVTSEQFRETFGFRGEQFGASMPQNERQANMNQAYDALMDLAGVVGIPPKALSLNGELGLAFGARGTGGKNPAAAHYERDTTGAVTPNRVVINLTRKSGAGSLAHEWFHAVDNYFARMRGEKAGMLTDSFGNKGEGVRPEMVAAFKRLMNVISISGVHERSKQLDKKRVKDYWSTGLEMAARSFESYVIAKLQDNNGSNDYLANIVPESLYAMQSSYPYPVMGEMPAIRAAFDHFFDTVQTKETEQGVAMFSRSTPTESGPEKNALKALSENDELFALPKSDKDTVEGIAADTDPGITVKKLNHPGLVQTYVLTLPDGGRAKMMVRKVNPYGPQSYGTNASEDGEANDPILERPGNNADAVPDDTENVYIDVSALKEGGQGARIYNIAATFAHNTGRILIGDPAGLSDIAMRRRTEHMLSSVLKFGTTRHIAPHPRQVDGASGIGVPPLNWTYGDDLGNIKELIETSLESLDHAGANLFTFDLPTGTFRDSGGRVLDDSAIRSIVEQGRRPESSAGVTTYKRSAVLSALVREEGAESRAGGQGAGILAQLVAVGRQFPASSQKIFYSRSVDGTAGLPASQVQSIVDRIAGRWSNAPAIIVAANMEDALIPQAVRDYDQKQKSLGATGEPEGFVDRGKVYLVADQLATPSDVMRVLFHEALGHMGLRGVFGDKLKPLLTQLAALRRDDIAIKARQYGLIHEDSKPEDSNADIFSKMTTRQRLEAAEEVLAELAQTHPELGYVKRAIGLIRSWLRANVPGFQSMKLTDADIISNFLIPARRHIEGNGAPNGGKKVEVSGTSATQPDFSRSTLASYTQHATDRLNEAFSHPGMLSLWDKTVGSMYHLAERSPPFKRVFNAAQDFINDVSYYAAESADLAPKILPKLESWKDMLKNPVSALDNKAISAPILQGTLSWARDEAGAAVKIEALKEAAKSLTVDQKSQRLLRGDHISAGILKMWRGLPVEQYETMVESKYQTAMLKAGIVFTDAELVKLFKLNPEQISLYREFRAATDKSLDNLAKADLLRFGGKDVEPLRDMVMGAATADEAAVMLRDYLHSQRDLMPERVDDLTAAANGMIERADKVSKLKKQGYAPLSRFGRYSVDVVVDGKREYFNLFESKAAANQMAVKMRQEFGAVNVAQGTMSQKEFEQFQGITPESLELFGNMLGLNSTGDEAQDKAFQTYLKLTKTNRSAMKRMIHRQGIAGYSEDMGRVLAAFVYSNARQTSAALHMGTLGKAVQDIPKGQGELKDAAIELATYIKQPREEAQALRGLLFAQYLGGSVASAFVNFTQPITVSFPYLSQFGGAAKAGAALIQAMKDQKYGKPLEAGLREALHRADEKGTTQPQSVHELMAQAQGRAVMNSGDGTKTGDAKAFVQNNLSKLALGWGKLFGLAEQVNRRSTFIAAYRLAVDQKISDPEGFATKAVNETQFISNKANKAKFARGAIGSTLMTFKSYSVNYLELLHRMATQNGPEGKKAAALMLGMLMLMAGAGGLPFEDDLEDVVDSLAQWMGYNFSTKKAKQEFLEQQFGKAMAQFIDKGISGLPGSPIDTSGRMTMGNLIPGTGFLISKRDHTSDAQELLGPVGDLIKRGFNGGKAVLTGDFSTGLKTLAPKAVYNALKGADMAGTGNYNDDRGYKVIEATPFEAAMKAIGFQPSSVAEVQQSNYLNQRAKDFYSLNTQDVSARWAKGIYEKDPVQIEDARAMVQRWNENNPDQRMKPNMPAILRRVKEMRKSKADRVADTAPKAMRSQMQREVAQAREDSM